MSEAGTHTHTHTHTHTCTHAHAHTHTHAHTPSLLHSLTHSYLPATTGMPVVRKVFQDIIVDFGEGEFVLVAFPERHEDEGCIRKGRLLVGIVCPIICQDVFGRDRARVFLVLFKLWAKNVVVLVIIAALSAMSIVIIEMALTVLAVIAALVLIVAPLSVDAAALALGSVVAVVVVVWGAFAAVLGALWLHGLTLAVVAAAMPWPGVGSVCYIADLRGKQPWACGALAACERGREPSQAAQAAAQAA